MFFLGMVPHKTKRGMEAMNRMKVFDGIPPPYDKVCMFFFVLFGKMAIEKLFFI